MLRRPRNAALVSALALVCFVTGAAHADVATCVLRLRDSHPGKAARADALRAVWSTAVPSAAQPLLGGGGATRARDAASLAANDPRPQHPFARWYVLEFPSVPERDAALVRLRDLPEVDVVEPVRTLEFPESTDGPRLAAPLREVPWNVQRLRAPEALARVQPDSSLIVAVIDSGADLDHPDLQHRLWVNDDGFGNARREDDTFDQNGDGIVETWEQWDDDDNGYVDDFWGYDFTDAPGQGGVGDATERDAFPDDENGHGTHVSGIIAADGQLVGVAPFVRLMVVRAAFNRAFFGGALETDDVAAAIVYAVDNGARVLNLSFGDTADSRLMREAIDYALERDVVVVAAAGNSANEAAHYPSSYPGVIGVGASNRADRRATFSNFGAGVELMAPGEDSPSPGPGIVSLGLGGDTRERRGTSMSAPHVVGAAALVLSRADRPDARRARALLISSAWREGETDWSRELGHGRVDALAAVTTSDDVVVQAIAPAQPYRDGWFRLLGTVWSGDPPRWRVDVRPQGGAWMTLVGGQTQRVVADTLVSMALRDVPEGDWEFRLAVELGDGRRREARGAFVVDASPPVVLRSQVSAVWRGAAPRWFVNTITDDPVRVSVLDASNGTALLAHPGFDRFVRLEGAAVEDGVVGWALQLTNASGGSTSMHVPRPAVLAAWPEQARVVPLDATSAFAPQPVVSRAPQGGSVVWGRGPFGVVQAWAVQGDQLVSVFGTDLDARPVAAADVNGDAEPDLLLRGRPSGQGVENVHWLLTRAAGTFPDSLVSGVMAARALGFFDLDDDPAFETLLSTDDKIFIYDDAVGRFPALVQTLVNPSDTSFNTYGSHAAVGDVDQDGRLEIVCGDADGAISVFERGPDGVWVPQAVLASGGSYAYEYAPLPQGGFIVGRQRTQDVAGDGFETTVYDFITYGPNLGAQRVRAFVARLNALDAGVQSFRSSASGDAYLVLAHEDHVYVTRGESEPREHLSVFAGAGGELPAIADFDDDGRVEFVVSTVDGARLLRFFEDVRGPHSLRTESLGPSTLRLRWQSGNGTSSRVQRLAPGDPVTLGETSANVWIDSTLQAFVPAMYQIQAVEQGELRGASNVVQAQAQPRPRLREAAVSSASSLRLRFSNPLHADGFATARVRVRDADGIDHDIVSLTLSEHGRSLDVIVAGVLACGAVDVEADSLRDDQWGLLDPPQSATRTTHACAAASFHVARIEPRTQTPVGLRVEFNRAPEAAASEVGTYDVRWNGAPVPLQSVQAVDARRVDLLLAPGITLRGFGIPYEVRIDAALRAAGDGALQEDAGRVHRVYVQGRGAPQVFASPNPAKASDDAIVFAETAEDTRIRIYNLEGELVRELQDSRGGGLRWDLRHRDGRPVSSGVYVFVARDSRGTTRGRVAILR